MNETTLHELFENFIAVAPDMTPERRQSLLEVYIAGANGALILISRAAAVVLDLDDETLSSYAAHIHAAAKCIGELNREIDKFALTSDFHQVNDDLR